MKLQELKIKLKKYKKLSKTFDVSAPVIELAEVILEKLESGENNGQSNDCSSDDK